MTTKSELSAPDHATAPVSAVSVKTPTVLAPMIQWFGFAQVEAQFPHSRDYIRAHQVLVCHSFFAGLPSLKRSEILLINTPGWPTIIYTKLKEELIKRTSESDQKRLQKLLTTERARGQKAFATTAQNGATTRGSYTGALHSQAVIHATAANQCPAYPGLNKWCGYHTTRKACRQKIVEVFTARFSKSKPVPRFQHQHYLFWLPSKPPVSFWVTTAPSSGREAHGSDGDDGSDKITIGQQQEQ